MCINFHDLTFEIKKAITIILHTVDNEYNEKYKSLNYTLLKPN